MKQEETTSWLYFCMLYCIGTWLVFIGCFAVQILLPVSVYQVANTEGETLGNMLVLGNGSEPTEMFG